MNTKRLFYNWLQKENCLKQFKYNTKHYNQFRSNVFSLYEENPDLFISLSFRWDETDEGYTYWLDKDDAWIAFLEDKYPNLIN